LATDRDTAVLIVGGGIAGLTAAVALGKSGIDSLVFEQAEDVQRVQVGAGVSLGYNVARAFRHLGLLDELTEVAVPIERFRFVTDKGKLLGTPPGIDGELSQGILRPVFHEFLVSIIGEDRVQVGAKLVRFEQDDDGVTAHFADGRTARGDVLIGADGLRSTVRAQLLGESEPRYAGFCARQGVVETDVAEEGTWQTALGRGQHFKSYPVGRGCIYWTAATNEPLGGKEKGAALKRTVLERFGDWPDPIRPLVEATDESRTYFAEAYDRDPVERWGEGRVTLLGDAAHPMTWNRGQGASQGVEGAVLLAKQLAQAGDDPAGALRAWEAERIPKTGKMVRSSRQSGKIEQAEKLPVCLMRNAAMRVMTSGPLFRRVNKDLLVEY
jgi:2-polyprenyl-6-methoxyphenol hydroxylase-like FAD-dependent oxidoreductase